MRLHHIGIAARDMNNTIACLEEMFEVAKKSPITWDEHQKAKLCMLELLDGSRIELVAGEAVKNIVRKRKLYHVCYETRDLDASIKEMEQMGALLIVPPKEAVLFENRRVAFLQTEIGMVELLEECYEMVDQFIEAVERRDMLQGKYLVKSAEKMTKGERQRLEKVMCFFEAEGCGILEQADAYMALIAQVRQETKYFLEHGHYRYTSYEEAAASVYQNEDFMRKLYDWPDDFRLSLDKPPGNYKMV